MPSGYKVDVGGTLVDLDNVFVTRLAPKAGNVNFKSSGVDLSSRYEPITVTGQRWDNNTNYNSGNTDLADIFAVSYPPTPTPSLTPSGTPPATPPASPTPSKSYV